MLTSSSRWRRLTPGSLIRRSASVPRPIDQAGRAQRVAGAVDLEGGVRRPGAGALVVVGDAGLRLAADPEAAGRQVVGGLEGDAIGPGEDVALRVGVVLQLVDEVLLERAAEAGSRSRSVGGQLDVEVVGHQPALAAEHLGVVVALALERGGDLDGLHGAAEGPREDTGDHRSSRCSKRCRAFTPVPPLLALGSSSGRGRGGQASHTARPVPPSVPAGRVVRRCRPAVGVRPRHVVTPPRPIGRARSLGVA